MITRDDVLDALTKSTAYDSQHTPTPSQILIEAWLEHFDRYAPAVEREELIDAVSLYHREPRARMLQPADLSGVARALRRDSLDRSPLDSPRRLALEARADAKADDDNRTPQQRANDHRDRVARVLERFDLKSPDDDKPASYIGALMDSPLRVRCPWCNASIGQRCMVPGTAVKLERSRAHPARGEAAEKARADA